MKKKKWDPNDIRIDAIDADPQNQPRKSLDSGQIKRIVDELRAGGFIRKPILVVENPRESSAFASGEESRYTLFDGFHRYEAAVRAGLDTIPAQIVADSSHAYQIAGESNNHEGARWSRDDARRHIANGLKNGTYVNTNGNPWPLSVLEEKFKRYGVTRRNLTLFLDKLAKDDEEIAEVMALIRAAYDKQNQPNKPPKTKQELSKLAAEKRLRIIHSYFDRAFTQMSSMSQDEREAILRTYRLAKLPPAHKRTPSPKPDF